MSSNRRHSKGKRQSYKDDSSARTKDSTTDMSSVKDRSSIRLSINKPKTGTSNQFPINYGLPNQNWHGPSAGSGIISPMFFNPFFHQSNTTNPTNVNYLNQGIFIPQSSEKNQFFFIPGNIGAENPSGHHPMFKNVPLHTNDELKSKIKMLNDSERTDTGNDENSSAGSSKQIYFVPSSDIQRNSIQDELKNSENYETYLVPIKIKKETNGNIELLPENNTETTTQPMNSEQINILKKIYFLKNQNQTEIKSDNSQFVKLDDKFLDNIDKTNDADGKNLISNIKDKSQGYMMVRFKPSDDIHKSGPALAHGSLKLSSADIPRSHDGVADTTRHTKHKKKTKSHTLILSSQNSKNVPPAQSTSRFRRLRIDDKRHCWSVNTSSCMDTKMREIPSSIIDLSNANLVTIPPTLFKLLNQPEVIINLQSSVSSCEHYWDEDKKIKEALENSYKSRFWRYMCSMNNCEFSKSQKRIF